jgi:exodeoxyribonuclease-1
LKEPDSFLWHDYETFGANPMVDRPSQFAAQRTDAELKPIGDPVTLYCAPSDDVLPHPMACLITGITPQEAAEKGLPETDFAAHVQELMMQPGTCAAGYNSIRFDDTVTRNLLYRNLRDPYEREWRNGNSRWDLIDLARMCYALRPDGVEWPFHEPGKPSFRLEDLTAANDIEHQGAHDALVDVRATIALARRIRTAQPKLFNWALGLRDKKAVARMLDPAEPAPLLHTSSRIPATRGCTSLVLPLAVVPNQPQAVVVFDLAADPSPLIQESAEMIHDLVFTPASDMPEGIERLPLKKIQANRVPMIAPLGTLKGVDTARIDLDVDSCKEHARKILACLEQVRPKVAEVFSTRYEDASNRDPDRMLYSGGFFSAADRHLMNKILNVPAKSLREHLWTFQDDRLPLMLLRYRARNYPESLSLKEREIWNRDRKTRLVDAPGDEYFTLGAFRQELELCRRDHAQDQKALEILDKVESWVNGMGLEDL